VNGFTKRKFLSLDLKQQHKKCAEKLRLHYIATLNGEPTDFAEYNAWLSWMKLLAFEGGDLKFLADRYHWHLKEANQYLKEHNLLPSIRTKDRTPKADFGNVAIYLDNVRSAYNVGSILRTVEALRIGTVYFSEKTPFIDNEKVQRTAMGAAEIVPVKRDVLLKDLPRPLIALETCEDATAVSEFLFPNQFTLILGNEEYGISEDALKLADFFVEIPLVGVKNSLNVACAFAIAAAKIIPSKTGSV